MSITQDQINKLEQALELAKHTTIEMPPEVFAAMIAGIESVIDELKQERKAQG